MNIRNKEPYDSPQCEMLEAKAQSIICQSGNTEQYGNVIDPNWGWN